MSIVPVTSHRSTLSGQRIAFTGRLASVSRKQASDAIRRAGGTPTTTISRRTTMLVVGGHGWPLVRDGGVSRALVEAERLLSDGHPIRILPEAALLDMLRDDAPAPTGEVHKSYPLDRVASLVEVKPATIRRWEHLGLVRSQGGLYDFQDIVSLQMIASLMRRGVQPATIQQSLSGLSSTLPGTERPLAQLNIVVADSGELLAQIDDTLIAPDGQHHLNFGMTEAPRREATPIAEGRAGGAGGGAQLAPDAQAWFERALRLEEEEAYHESADAYREAISQSPRWSEAYFNLGNVIRTIGQPAGALELYKLAVLYDVENELIWYNLADVQEEVGDVADAIVSLKAALDLSPDFADAHFNLASCLEQDGHRLEARSHWKRYLAHDPDSEWAEIARKRLR